MSDGGSFRKSFVGGVLEEVLKLIVPSHDEEVEEMVVEEAELKSAPVVEEAVEMEVELKVPRRWRKWWILEERFLCESSVVHI